MKPLLAALALTASLAGAAVADPTSTEPGKMRAGVYELDPRHASLVVKIPHMGGFSRYTMRFNRLKGAFTYDPATWQTTKVTISVDPTSVDTGDAGFNKTIAGYFDAAKYRTITFVTQSVAPAADGTGKLAGELTFHGVTKPVTLDVTFNGFGPGLLGLGTRAGFSGAGRIKRSDFGVDAVRDVAGDDIDLIFDVEFVKQ
jgi:polyisoprenoid-binding protein YceI